METSNNNRNNKGQFAKGHAGAKPKGAISKQHRKYFQRIERIVGMLEINLQQNINNMSEKEQVMLWLELQKFMHSKFTKFTDPSPEVAEVDKTINITFERG